MGLDFFRDSYRMVMRWLVMMASVCVGLALILGYLVFNPESPKSYATTTTGEVVALHALNEPVVTTSYLLQWASLRAREVYNLSFAQYQQQLAQQEQYFTPSGWKKLREELEKSGLLTSIRDKKLDTSAIVYGPPVILSSMVVSGRFTWRVQLPLLVTYISANDQRKSKYIVTMDIQRVPVIDVPKGIQIKSFYVVGTE